MNKTKVVILSAGQSIRMKTHKALLRWDNKYNFIQKIIREYQASGVQDISVVLNKRNKQDILGTLTEYDFDLLINNDENSERIDSIKLAVNNIDSRTCAFIQDVDHPFIHSHLIAEMQTKMQANSYVLPDFEGTTGHPVLLSAEIVQLINNEHYMFDTLKDVLKQFRAITIEVNSNNSLKNINTPEDYKQYFGTKIT